MERTQWRQFLLRTLLVVGGLALETFRPADKAVLCHTDIPSLVQAKAEIDAQLALKFNSLPQGGAILESFERRYSPFEGWGDYPQPNYSRTAIV